MKKWLLFIVLGLVPTQLAHAGQDPDPDKEGTSAVKEEKKPGEKESDRPKNLDPSPKNEAIKPGTIQRM